MIKKIIRYLKIKKVIRVIKETNKYEISTHLAKDDDRWYKTERL